MSEDRRSALARVHKMDSVSNSKFEIKESEQLGQYLVTKTDFRGGTLLFEETPLFLYSEFCDTILNPSKSSCISCYQQVLTKDVVKCKKCKWHFCSLECSEFPNHLRYECDILSKNKILPTRDSVTNLYLLRFVNLKKKERNKWDAIMSMVSKPDVEDSKQDESVNLQALSAQAFLTRCNINVPHQHIVDVINIFRINEFLMLETDKAFSGLYKACSFLANSCCPNSEYHHLKDRCVRGTIGILSTRDIAAGEMVTISYCEDHIELGSHHRQATIVDQFQFLCACERCMDPTELGTFYSAVKCNRCPEGWLLPVTYFSKENASRCNKCDNSMSLQQIEQIELTFRQQMDIALSNETDEQKKKECKLLDKLISNATSMYQLHSNHNLVINAIQRWIDAQNFDVLLKSTEESRILYEKTIERAGRRLEVFSRFGKVSAQAFSSIRISSTLIRYHFKSDDLRTIQKDIANPQEKLDIIVKITRHLSSSIRLLTHSYFNNKATATLLKSMSERHAVWKKRLLRCHENMFLEKSKRVAEWRAEECNRRSQCKSDVISDSPFEVRKSDKLGRYLVAKRDVPVGTLILEEVPLFMYAEFSDDDPENEVTNCISCYQKLPSENVVACSRCSWPCCSRKCSRDPIHTEEECKILKESKVLPSSNRLFYYLNILRMTLLRKKDKKKWEEIMNLTSKISIENLRYNKSARKHARKTQEYMERSKDNICLEDIEKLINILRSNHFRLDGEEEKPYRCLYRICSLLTHNCSPNAEWYHLKDRQQEGTIGIVSQRDIAAGEMVTISYCQMLLPLGTLSRQASILSRFDFFCACPRCTDPTELGTFSSAIKCKKCLDGWLLPPTGPSDDNVSTCNKCSHSTPTEKAEKIEYVFRRQVDLAQNKKKFLWISSRQRQLTYLDKLISDATTRYKLHPNHNLVIWAIKGWLVRAIPDLNVLVESTNDSGILYLKVIERAERCLAIVNQFGKLSDQVEMDNIISSTLIRYHFKSNDLLAIKKAIYDPYQKQEIYSKIVGHLSTAARLVKLPCLDAATAATVSSMSERYNLWKRRI